MLFATSVAKQFWSLETKFNIESNLDSRSAYLTEKFYNSFLILSIPSLILEKGLSFTSNWEIYFCLQEAIYKKRIKLT